MKILAKCSQFDVSSLGLKFQVSILGVFDEFSVSEFKSGLGLEGCALDCITGLNKHKSCFKLYYQ